ncbi:MAG: leucine-rich repeat domain-containing protein [Prevotella sp.]|nr:leucine-rich repeat domain-containing protein [Prevotella sp.]
MKQVKLTFLLTVLMSMVGTKAFAYDISVKNADGVEIRYNWNYNKTELSVAGCLLAGNVVIPTTVTYNGKDFPVTSIDYSAFFNYSGLTSITIPNSVTRIGRSAFSGCSGLTSITIPNSVTSIGESAFYSCRGLTSITIGNSVTSIGSEAFKYCSGLTSVTIPNSVTSIGNWAFSDCSSLTDVTLHCKEVSSWFSGMKAIKNVIFGQEVTTIGNSAFSGCSGLESVTMSNSINTIGKSAFSDTSLSSILIPYSVNNIGISAFSGCSKLQQVIVKDLESWCKIDFGNETSNPLYLAGHLYSDETTEITELTIPESITKVGNYAFNGWSALKTLAIHNNVTEVGTSAFDGCVGLLSVKIGENVESIKEKAFNNCSGLTVIQIPNSVTRIEASAFAGTSLNSLTIGTGVTFIGNNAFANDKPVKTIWFTNTPPSGYTNAIGVYNYVSNGQYTSIKSDIKTIYPYLSSNFTIGGVKYVPVSPSERTCEAIDCIYGDEAENIKIGEEVLYQNVQLSVKAVKPYTFYSNKFIKT